MRVLVILLACLSVSACALPAPIAPSEGPWRFSGTVYVMNGSATGGPIAGAAVTMAGGENSAQTTTDAAGHFALAEIKAGRYTVTIVAPGFASATPVVDLYRDLMADFALERR